MNLADRVGKMENSMSFVIGKVNNFKILIKIIINFKGENQNIQK